MIVVVAGAAWYQQTSVATAENTDNEANGVTLQPVSVMKVSGSESSIMPQRYTATVVARRTSSLAFQASERIDEILCDEGDYVAKGQLLAQQDQAALQAQFNAATATVQQTAALLNELENGPRDETIEAMRAQLEQLKAQSELAKANYNRQKQLMATRAASREEFDSAKFNFEASIASVAAANQQLQELENGTRKEQIDAQRAALEVIKATADQAKTRLDQTRLFAPFSGRISKRFVDEGSIPQRGAPVLEIVESDQLEVRFGASLTVAQQLHPESTITFSVNGKSTIGKVRQISPVLNRSTRTQQVIVDIDGSEETGLVDGQTVQIEFALRNNEPGFWIPTESLQPQVRGLWSVLIADTRSPYPSAAESTAERREVVRTATWGQWSRVKGTLSEGELVVVEGANRIANGQRVSASLINPEFPWKNEATNITASVTTEGVQ